MSASVFANTITASAFADEVTATSDRSTPAGLPTTRAFMPLLRFSFCARPIGPPLLLALYPADDLAGLVEDEYRLRRAALNELDTHVPLALLRLRGELARILSGTGAFHFALGRLDRPGPVQRCRRRDPAGQRQRESPSARSHIAWDFPGSCPL